MTGILIVELFLFKPKMSELYNVDEGTAFPTKFTSRSGIT